MALVFVMISKTYWLPTAYLSQYMKIYFVIQRKIKPKIALLHISVIGKPCKSTNFIVVFFFTKWKINFQILSAFSWQYLNCNKHIILQLFSAIFCKLIFQLCGPQKSQANQANNFALYLLLSVLFKKRQKRSHHFQPMSKIWSDVQKW